MNFREFVKLYEGGGIFGGPSLWPDGQGTTRVGAKDWFLHQFGNQAGPTPTTKGAAPSFAGSGPGLGSAQPTGARKMKKK